MGRGAGGFRKKGDQPVNSTDKEVLRGELMAAGAVAAGFTTAGKTASNVDTEYRAWLRDKKNAGMKWMERHADLRHDPANILPEVKTIISLAFPYGPGSSENLPDGISAYARGEDYHSVIRQRLNPIFKGREGKWRICIDSAPLPERYWAAKAGIGFIGDNGALIIPGVGSQVFLAEILTDREYTPDAELSEECLHCGRCRKICPSGAMDCRLIDCRRCISYLTIEHRGPWTDKAEIDAMNSDEGHSTIFGCDRCVTVCPLNNLNYPPLPEFRVTETARRIAEGSFKEISLSDIKQSPIYRAFPDGLERNLKNYKNKI